MTLPTSLQLAPTPSSLKPFRLTVQDVTGRTIWEVTERGSRSPLRYTRLRGLGPLTLHAQGPSRQLWIRRPAGLVRYRYDVEDALGNRVWRIVCPWFVWKVRDRSGTDFASVTFTNPTIVATDKGRLRTPRGLEVARLEIRPVVPFGSRWKGSLTLNVSSEEWEALAVVLASIRIAHKQIR